MGPEYFIYKNYNDNNTDKDKYSLCMDSPGILYYSTGLIYSTFFGSPRGVKASSERMTKDNHTVILMQALN